MDVSDTGGRCRSVISMFKDILSDTGHQTTITQRIFDLHARDREDASQLAKARFCDLEEVED